MLTYMSHAKGLHFITFVLLSRLPNSGDHVFWPLKSMLLRCAYCVYLHLVTVPYQVLAAFMLVTAEAHIACVLEGRALVLYAPWLLNCNVVCPTLIAGGSHIYIYVCNIHISNILYTVKKRQIVGSVNVGLAVNT